MVLRWHTMHVRVDAVDSTSRVMLHRTLVHVRSAEVAQSSFVAQGGKAKDRQAASTHTTRVRSDNWPVRAGQMAPLLRTLRKSRARRARCRNSQVDPRGLSPCSSLHLPAAVVHSRRSVGSGCAASRCLKGPKINGWSAMTEEEAAWLLALTRLAEFQDSQKSGKDKVVEVERDLIVQALEGLSGNIRLAVGLRESQLLSARPLK